MTEQIALNLRPEPSYSFDNFVQTDSRETILSILKSWPARPSIELPPTESPDKKIWPGRTMVLIGPKGCGKTHLGQAWAKVHDNVCFIDEAPIKDEMMLFHRINQALRGDLAGVILAQREPYMAVTPDLQSRLKAMPKLVLEDYDDPDLEPILRHLFTQLGRDISKDVVDYLLKYAERSIDALRALAAQLDAAASVQKCDITKRFAAQYLAANHAGD